MGLRVDGVLGVERIAQAVGPGRPGMNCAMPSAPARDRAAGSNPDSRRSWAASSAADTLQRLAARRSAARKRSGT